MEDDEQKHQELWDFLTFDLENQLQDLENAMQEAKEGK